ncbi:4-amino-4-deoxy-L-arabinose transferase-like glycosyltransferase [Sphingomonas sp. UYAg733]
MDLSPSSRWKAAALLLIVTVALRMWDFGNPVVHVDEQYYLLVGDRMLQGDIPYIDIWDRKPIGLFLLFAGIRLLPGDGILAYQIVATLFAAGTAWMVDRGAMRLGTARAGALAAAIAYLIWLSLLNGRGGQSPVFYNLFVTGAALLTLRLPALAEERKIRAIVINGLIVCLLSGIAIQMKYTPAFEGAYFGLVHLWFLHRARAPLPITVGAGLIWILAGLTPTLAAIGCYAWQGPAALDSFWFANFASITLRPGYPIEQIGMRLLGIAAQLSPLIVAAGIAWRWRRRVGLVGEGAIIAWGWLGAALIAFAAIGTYFDHYALPLIAPLTLVAAPALARSSRILIGVLGLALLLFITKLAMQSRDAEGAREVARIVKANSGPSNKGECPWIAIGDTITYRLAESCLPTAYIFPNLLVYSTEHGATGINEAAEVRRILANRPPVIVASSRPLQIWNRESTTMVSNALASDYRLVFSTPRSNYRTLVYLRRDRAFRRGMPE